MTQTAEVVMTADILVVWRGMLLLIKRGKWPYQGQWAIPGGKLDEGELLIEAAHRELYEETGVEVAEMRPIGNFDAVQRDPRGRFISAAYLVGIDDAVEVTLRSQVQSDGVCEIREVRWFPLNELPEDLAFDHAEIIERAMQPL